MNMEIGDTNRQIVLAQRPNGELGPECFSDNEAALPNLEPNQILVKTTWLSIDPSIRVWMQEDTYLPAIELDSVIRCFGLGIVVASNNPTYAVGSTVTGFVGWQEYAVLGPEARVIPDALTPETTLSVLGPTGLTAYFGMLKIGKPTEGESVLVSGAAGATGSIAGQIARIHGCRVVGLAGTDQKCQRLRDTYQFDAAINYRTEDVSAAISKHCPNGINVFFDNVGGSILEAGIQNLALHGRIVLCGAISSYNTSSPHPGPKNLSRLISMRGTMQGFIVLDYLDEAPQAISQLASWVANGELAFDTDVTDGLENAPGALRRLFDGANRGKTLVRL